MASESQPTIEEALQAAGAQEARSQEQRVQEQLYKPGIAEMDVRLVFWKCLERAHFEQVSFGGVGANMMARHLDWFWKGNGPTMHVPGLTKWIIVDEFFRSTVNHHFHKGFVSALRSVLRMVERDCTPRDQPLSLDKELTGERSLYWYREVVWVKRPRKQQRLSGKHKAVDAATGERKTQRARTAGATQ
eukprot:CAMPEP_0181290294 /NCGR_PEP_ID=MMETSP1101-20121128/1338_1 /TAXON_ID=46948 /ORGANISM="Rhodomonas abbreviata, Strain Caron Lab Isolate" /LENGTH=188 /DNA_ID=CAMNT_0023394571 /DNA_START=10 /DNA_END=573 /DNA_ORIENTATION=-